MAGRVSLSDDDQYNRIFIIGVSQCTTQDIKDAFEPFGQITDVYSPRSKSREGSSKFTLVMQIISIFCSFLLLFFSVVKVYREFFKDTTGMVQALGLYEYAS